MTWSLPCGCTFQPGIDLPISECDPHRDDPTLAHRDPSQTSTGVDAVPAPSFMGSSAPTETPS